jgi:hypothetical protein
MSPLFFAPSYLSVASSLILEYGCPPLLKKVIEQQQPQKEKKNRNEEYGF